MITFGAYWVLEQIIRTVPWVLHRVPVVRDWGWLARLRRTELDCKQPIGRPGFAENPRPTAFTASVRSRFAGGRSRTNLDW